jgi:3alpha(or 20beta)-hydroxysteroid dehydrogenase
MQGRLSGKVAIITGGARGQGASHARFMIKEGAKVVVTDLRVEQGEALAAELGAAVRFIQHDVAKPEDWERVVAETEAAFGPVSVLVNNAGIGFLKNLEHTSLEEYQHVIAVCQTSVFLGMRAVIASMRRAGGGSIINISSIVADRGIPGNIAYSAAKAAIVGMGKVAALELLEDNIRVNTIMPGMIRTPAVEELPADRIPELNEGIPIKRMASVEEVSHLVVYLASDESSYSTGSDFVVDGGIRASR